MAFKETLQKLATEKNEPCVSISLNTHRTHPDNIKDELVLKNLLKEAEERVIHEYGKRPVTKLLEKINSMAANIDVNKNLDSLHIFLSNETEEVFKSSWKSNKDSVHIADSFALQPVIKSYNRSENYLVVLLSQSGVQLYEALNDEIIDEIKNDDFPFAENRHFNTNPDRGSDSKYLDDLVREFLNKVDKALVKVHNETDLNFVVVCTEDNYSRLQQVADKPSVYLGYAAIDYNNTATHQIVKQTWEIIRSIQHERRTAAIADVKEAVAQGKVLTDLQDIFTAAVEGRGDTLIVHQDFKQTVKINDNNSIERIDDSTEPNAIDDISSNIAWEVISKKGKVYFTSQNEIKDLGDIVLKTRY